ncbi:MAG: hypothetical protein P8074_20975 [Anaerolineales bacterium]|jgi:hypothetical protein
MSTRHQWVFDLGSGGKKIPQRLDGAGTLRLPINLGESSHKEGQLTNQGNKQQPHSTHLDKTHPYEHLKMSTSAYLIDTNRL